jgi:hypothetical protein
VLPLEIAIQADPELARQRRSQRGETAVAPGGPPEAIAAYLAAEQRLGRVRGDVDPGDAALVLLASLFGLGMTGEASGSAGNERIGSLVRLVVRGLVGPKGKPA